MRIHTGTGAVLVALLLWSFPAAGYEEESRVWFFMLGPSAGFLDKGLTGDSEEAAGLNVRVGLRKRNLAVEVEFEWIDNAFTRESESLRREANDPRVDESATF